MLVTLIFIMIASTPMFSESVLVHPRIEVNSSGKIRHKSDEIVMQANNDLNLTCSGEKPQKWKYSNYHKPEEFPSIINITEWKKEGKYFSKLSLEDAYHYDTGYFVCYPADNINSNDSISLYVYVEDPDSNQFVNPEINYLVLNENDNLTIPCKPTSPLVNVTLANIKDIAFIPGEDFHGNIIEYFPRTGFHLGKVNDNFTNDIYICSGKEMSTGTLDLAIFEVTILKHIEYIDWPKVKKLPSKLVVSVGEHFALNCSVRVEPNITVSFKWDAPINKENRFTITRMNSEVDHEHGKRLLERSTLTINNVTLADEGYYDCKVVDSMKYDNEKSFFIKVQKP